MAESKNRIKSFIFDRGLSIPAALGATSVACVGLILLPYWSFLDDEVDQLIKEYTGLETDESRMVTETRNSRWIAGSGMDTKRAEHGLIGDAALLFLITAFVGLAARSAANPNKSKYAPYD